MRYGYESSTSTFQELSSIWVKCIYACGKKNIKHKKTKNFLYKLSKNIWFKNKKILGPSENFLKSIEIQAAHHSHQLTNQQGTKWADKAFVCPRKHTLRQKWPFLGETS